MTRNPLWAGLLAIVVVVILAVTALGGGGEDDAGSAGGVTGGDFHSLVVDPTDPQRIFVGGHQAVSVSTDGGATWEEVDSLRYADAMGWALTSDAVYVSGHPGLNRSTDVGASFERTNQVCPAPTCTPSGGPTVSFTGPRPRWGCSRPREAWVPGR